MAFFSINYVGWIGANLDDNGHGESGFDSGVDA